MSAPHPPPTTALTVALESESLEALYRAWLQHRLEHAQAQARRARERDQLDTRAAYLVKTVAVARTLPDVAAPTPPKKKRGGPRAADALAVEDPLAKFHARADAELARARKALAAREKREEAEAARVDRRIRKVLHARADAHLRIHKPRVALTVHPVGPAHALVEVASPSDEDAVLLLRLLRQALPTRWGFLGDDAVDDLARGPAHFYADEGLAELWPPDADAEDAVLFADGVFLPVRGQLPFALPDRAFPRFKLVNHGRTAQIEARREGEPYAHLVRREDCELLSGYLLRLELSGHVSLALQMG